MDRKQRREKIAKERQAEKSGGFSGPSFLGGKSSQPGEAGAKGSRAP